MLELTMLVNLHFFNEEALCGVLRWQ